MKMLTTIVALFAVSLSQLVYSAPDPKYDLIGGKFYCGGRIMLNPITFLSANEYTAEGVAYMTGSYDYDGKILVLHDTNLAGKSYTMSFNAQYLSNKKKLILDHVDGAISTRICDEH